MKKLPQYSIPFRGLKDGLHHLTIQVDNNFFQHFEEAYLQQGNIALQVELDKRPNLLVLDIDFSGTVKTICDLCCEEGDLPIDGTERLLVKFTENPGDEDQVIYLMPGETELNLARHFYEFIALSVPIRKVPCADEDNEPTCDSSALDLIKNDTEKTEETINPVWAELDKLKNK